MRKIDHPVIFVNKVADSIARCGKLGFIAAPQSFHPFGTTNVCVFMGSDQYIEFMAIARPMVVRRQSIDKARFLRRLLAFTFRYGEGLAMVGYASGDVDADYNQFCKHGIEYGDIFAFERSVSGDTDNNSAGDDAKKIGFKLAFAVDERAPDATFFTCQRLKGSDFTTDMPVDHPNTAIRISGVIMTEPNPTDFQYYLHSVLATRDTNADSAGIRFPRDGYECQVMTPQAFHNMSGIESAINQSETRGLRLAAIVIDVKDIDRTRSLLRKNDVGIIDRGNLVIVPATKGQGGNFIFKATDDRD